MKKSNVIQLDDHRTAVTFCTPNKEYVILDKDLQDIIDGKIPLSELPDDVIKCMIVMTIRLYGDG